MEHSRHHDEFERPRSRDDAAMVSAWHHSGHWQRRMGGRSAGELAQHHDEEHPEFSPDWDGTRDDLEHDGTDQRVTCGDDAYCDQRHWA